MTAQAKFPDVEIEDTPNPLVKKFKPGRDVVGKGRSYEFSVFAQARPVSELASRLLELSEVAGVHLGSDFVSVAVRHVDDWPDAKILAIDAIEDLREEGIPFVRAEGAGEEAGEGAPAGEAEKKIVELIERRVRPAVARDGGDIRFRSYRDGVVYLTLHGACAGCPSSQATLRRGVECLLKRFVPEIERVDRVAD